MNDVRIVRAQRVLRFAPGNLEAGFEGGDRTTRAERVDEVYEHAVAQGGLDHAREGEDEAQRTLALAYLEEGRGALTEIAAKGAGAALSDRQLDGLEAIVRLIGRPSLLVQQDKVVMQGADVGLKDKLAVAEEQIGAVMRAVGRVELPEVGPPGYVGTAFLVSDDLVMTNRHVAEQFAVRKGGDSWAIEPGKTPSVDFDAERGTSGKRRHAVMEVRCIHDAVDLALLQLEPTDADGEPLPRRLIIDKDATDVSPRHDVYSVGYPARDWRNDSPAMKRIFGDIFFVKRMAPGEIIEPQPDLRQFTHDCSTLIGSSGSCVIDFRTHRVMGLHFSGHDRVENRAVALHQLAALSTFDLTFG